MLLANKRRPTLSPRNDQSTDHKRHHLVDEGGFIVAFRRQSRSFFLTHLNGMQHETPSAPVAQRPAKSFQIFVHSKGKRVEIEMDGYTVVPHVHADVVERLEENVEA